MTPCAACGAENPSEAKFCGSCGAALAAACAECGHLNQPGGRFCTECGGPLATAALDPDFASPESYTPPPLADKIRAARSEIEGERKQITVLFTDVAGFTRLAESLDPEETHALMRRCFDLMLAEVHRYEGTVSQFLGDGMLALFGAPIAHEDHAQRAVRAGLAIQSAMHDYQAELQESRGIDFRVRIGLNSGPVVVGTVGVDLTMSYLAIGDTVNLASRMQTLAEPGSVLISEHTHRLVDGYFVVRELGAREVKGKAEPVGVYEVLRSSRWRSRVDISAERGLTPFVGREAELEALLDRFEGASAGHGQVVFVRGEPGIGKSRLLYELRDRLADTEHAWLVGRCISYGGDIPYLPIVDLMKDAFAIEETDSEEEIGRKVAARAPAAGAPYLRHLLTVDPADESVPMMDPQLRKALTFEALRDLALGAAAHRTQVLVIEDLHWIDQASIEFLSYFVEQLGNHRILLLLTHRRDWQPPLGLRTYFTHLDLRSLSEEDSGVIAGGLLGADAVPAELRKLVFGKAEGNPFFVEEVIRSLLELGAIRRENSHYALARPIGEIDVPDTVQGVIMARLDRLADEPKRAMQTAAVIGREFTVRLLDRIADLPGPSHDLLRELKSVELIYERSLYPELSYMFKHALTHDVAYSSLLVARRKALHQVVAAAIEELYADRLPEHYETIAFHAELGEAWEQAFEYLRKSGDKALASFASEQANGFYRRALALSEHGDIEVEPARLIPIHDGRGQALYLLNRWDESAASFDSMRREAEAIGDEIQVGVALFNKAFSLFWGHRFEDAMAAAERARAIGLEQGNDSIVAGSLITIEGVYSVTGDQVRAHEAAEEASQVAARSQVPLLEGVTDVWAGFNHHWQGDETRALGLWNRATSTGREHLLPIVLLWSLWTRGMALLGRGRYDEAIASLREHLELTERLGDRVFRCRSLNTLGWAFGDLCDWESAVDHNRRALDEARAAGDPEIIRNSALNLADCRLALGDLDEAQRLLEEIERDCAAGTGWGETWMKWRYTQHLHASLGELWLARGDLGRALGYAERCIEAAETTNSQRNIGKGRRLRGKTLLAQGLAEEGQAELELALAATRAVGNPVQIWLTLEALGRPGEALEVVEGIAADLGDARLRATLLDSPQVVALRERVAASS